MGGWSLRTPRCGERAPDGFDLDLDSFRRLDLDNELEHFDFDLLLARDLDGEPFFFTGLLERRRRLADEAERERESLLLEGDRLRVLAGEAERDTFRFGAGGFAAEAWECERPFDGFLARERFEREVFRERASLLRPEEPDLEAAFVPVKPFFPDCGRSR